MSKYISFLCLPVDVPLDWSSCNRILEDCQLQQMEAEKDGNQRLMKQLQVNINYYQAQLKSLGPDAAVKLQNLSRNTREPDLPAAPATKQKSRANEKTMHVGK